MAARNNYPSAVGSFDRARELAATHAQPILALKAYSLWMQGGTISARSRALGLLDFALYCNKFAADEKRASDLDAHLRHARAQDYFQLVLDAFESLYHVQVSVCNAITDTNLAEDVCAVMPAKPVPAALIAALQLTLHNWACLEMSGDAEGMRMARRLATASRQVEEQTTTNMMLDWPWDAVQAVTSAVQAVMQCDFAAGEAAGRRAVELVRLNAKKSPTAEIKSEPSKETSLIVDDVDLLQAICYYALGLALETTACEESLACYEEALMHASESRSASLCQPAMEQAQAYLAAYIEEERHRERMRVAAEEAASAAHADRKGQGAGRGRKTQGGMRRTARKASNSRTSVSAHNLAPVVAPPVPEPLQKYLAEHGLSTVMINVCNFKVVMSVLAHSLPGMSDGDPLPPSVFAGTRFEASVAETAFVVPLCTATPLQWTLRLRDTANQPPTLANRSVWAPRPALAPLLTALAAERPPGPKSASASQTRKEIAEGNTKLRQQVLQLFAPPNATAKVKQNAHESVDMVVQLLGQRLGVLLKTERAFEDHWSATERVLSALQSYAVAQDLVRLKKTLLSQQRLRHLRRERSARTIAHFFRDIVGQRARRALQSKAEEQRSAAREQATVVLQKYARRWLARQEARRRAAEQAEYVEKVVVVQSLARRRFAEAACRDLRRAKEEQERVDDEQTRRAYAALQIQRVYRGHCSRLRCYHLRGLAHEATLHHLCDSRNYYATVIQKSVRGMLVRRQYGKAVYARRCYGRNVYRRQLWERSCVTIQRAFRAYRARRAIASRLKKPTTYERGVLCGQKPKGLLANKDIAAGRDGDADANAAAQCIQDAYRSCVARRRLDALKFARLKSSSANNEAAYATSLPFSLKECVF